MKIPKVISHRGGAARYPENTLAGFRRTVEIGADGVEFDVHRCASGELVVIHDDDLQRTTNGVGLIKESSWSEIKRLSAGRWFGDKFTDEKVPLLSEVLEVFQDSNLIINIEIKNTPMGYPDIEDDLLEALSGYSKRDNILVSSFDHQFLKRLREKDDLLQIGVLCAAMLLNPGEYAAQLGAKYYINAFDCLLPEAVSEAQSLGLQVVAWTLNNPRDWAQAIQCEVDAIVTDDPEYLQGWLTALKSQSALV